MKKILFVISFMAAILTSQACFAAEYAVFEGFETSCGSAVPYSTSVTVEHAKGGANGSDGCLKVTTTNWNGFQIPIDFYAGTKYKISFYIKYEDTLPGEQVKLIGSSGGGPDTGYFSETPVRRYGDGTAIENTTLNTWNKIELSYTPAADSTGEYIFFRPFSSNIKDSKVVYIDDLIIEPVSVAGTAPSISELSVSEPAFTGSKLDITYQSTADKNEAAVFADNGAGEYIVCSGDIKALSYTPGESLEGAMLKVKAVPFDGTTVGLAGVYEFTEPVSKDLEVVKSISGSLDDEKIEASVSVLSRKNDIDVLVILCLYDADNSMIGIEEESKKFTASAENEDPIVIDIDVTQDAASYKLFIWEGTTTLDTTLRVLD